MYRVYYYADPKAYFSSNAMKALEMATREVFGEDEPVEFIPDSSPGPGLLVFGKNANGGIRTLSPEQIPTASHAFKVLTDALTLYKNDEGGENPIHIKHVIDPPHTVWGQFNYEEPIAVDIETNFAKTEILCISVYQGGDKVYVFTKDLKKVATYLSWCMSVIGANFKFDQRYIKSILGVDVPLWFDTFLAHHTQNMGAVGYHGLKDAAQLHLGAPEWDKGIRWSKHHEPTMEELLPYAGWDAYWTYKLWEYLEEGFKKNPGLRQAFDFEMKLAEFYLQVELEGFDVDLKYTMSLHSQMAHELDILESSLPFNPNSPKQIMEWLKENNIGLKDTSAEELETVVDNKTVSDLLEYKKLKKGHSAFVVSILDHHKNGTVHPTFNVGGTKTGRLSSSEPNIHQQPRDAKYRNMWTTNTPGHIILACDYSQAEARVMASLSRDEWLRDKLMAQEDFFDSMLQDMFKTVDFTKITPAEKKEYRTKLKTVVYGLSFGRGARAIGKLLNIPTYEAQGIINTFLENAYKLNEWRSQIMEAAVDPLLRDRLINPLGRQFQMDVIHERNISETKRSALSFLPQSTASDICQGAAISASEALLDVGGRVVATVHDSIVTDCPLEGVENTAQIIMDIMEDEARRVLGDFVQFRSDYEYGTHWGKKMGGGVSWKN